MMFEELKGLHVAMKYLENTYSSVTTIFSIPSP